MAQDLSSWLASMMAQAQSPSSPNVSPSPQVPSTMKRRGPIPPEILQQLLMLLSPSSGRRASTGGAMGLAGGSGGPPSSRNI